MGFRGRLVGRDAQLAVLNAAFAELVRGRGRSILVEGEAGIGKTALVESVVGRCDPAAVEVLRGECDELGRDYPLSVMISALGISGRSVDPLRAETAAAVSAAAGVGIVVDAGDGVRAVAERLSGFVDRLCGRRPVVLVVDDLQWADEASLALWAELEKATVQLPLLLIGIRRQAARSDAADAVDAVDAALNGPPTDPERATVLRLGPLGRDEVLDVAEGILGARPGPGLAARLAIAEGNPLFVREVVDAFVRSGGPTAAAAGADVAGGSTEPIRADLTLAQGIAGRLDSLPRPARDLLQVAAVLGVEFSADDLSALTQTPEPEVVASLGEAVDAGVAERADDGRYRFRHGLIRQALYALLPEALRGAIYRDLAQHLIRRAAPVEQTAQAILSARDAADGWELAWLAAHAEELFHRAPEVVVELLGHAAATCALDDPRRTRFEDQWLTALVDTQRYAEAEQMALSILAESGDGSRRGLAAFMAMRAFLRTNRRAEALRLDADLADEPLTAVWRARLTTVRSHALAQLGRFDEARRVARAALAHGEELSDAETIGRALNALAVLEDLAGAFVSSAELLGRALTVLRDVSRLADLRAQVLANLLGSFDLIDEDDRAVEILRQAVELPDEIGPIRASKLWIQAGMVAFNHGRWDDALAELASVVAVSEEGQNFQVLYHSHALMIAIHRDDDAAVVRHQSELDALSGTKFWAMYATTILEAKALVAEREGHPEQTLELLGPLVDQKREDLRGQRFFKLPDLARVALALGAQDIARGAAEAARADADQHPFALKRGLCDWCLGVVEGDVVALAAAVDYFRGSRRLLQLGNSLEDLSHLHAVRGEADVARARLVEAMSVYAELGANWDARRAAARLRPLGVRLGVRGVRQRVTNGWASLSATELRVAELVASGLSNPEIATRLVLSRRTVQTHVSHVFGKLGVDSRRAIVDVARAHGA